MVDALTAGQIVGKYVLEKCIGNGAFATVWKAHHVDSLSTVAIKVISKDTISNQVAQTRLQREIALLKQMEHPFIADFFQDVEDEKFYFLVMEYVENGNLLEYVNINGRLSEDHARRYFTQLITCLEYLHNEKKVAHRDLKCENLLLDRYNNIRVIDFGLSNMFTDVCPQLSTACGSPAYAAPEMIQGNAYTTQADVWSAGILLFAIVAGHLPFDDTNVQKLLHKVVCTEPFYPPFMSPQLVDLLQKMLSKDPVDRYTISKIKEHPWFSQTEYYALLEQDFFSVYRNVCSNDMAGESGLSEKAIDKEIVDKIASFGVDVHTLHQSLLMDEYTDQTALYKILLRTKVTEMMKDSMANIMQTSPGMPMIKGSQQSQTMGPGQAGTVIKALRVGQMQKKTHFANAPFVTPTVGGGPRILGSPALKTANRRLSRPVAVRRPINMPNPSAVVSHEM